MLNPNSLHTERNKQLSEHYKSQVNSSQVKQKYTTLHYTHYTTLQLNIEAAYRTIFREKREEKRKIHKEI